MYMSDVSQFYTYRPLEFYYRKIRYERPYDVASGGASLHHVLYGSQWEKHRKCVLNRASSRKKPRIFLQLTQQKSYLWAGVNGAHLVKIGGG